MIKLAGSAHHSFYFPAPLAEVYNYYSDLPHVFSYLPYISMVTRHSDDHFRMLFSSTELGAYTIRIYCDMRATLDGGRHLIRIVPAEALPPIQPSASFNSTTGRGYFSFQSIFTSAGDTTLIEFKLQLQARLPRPGGMKLMIGSMVNSVAKNITDRRMGEVIEGFVEQTVEAYPLWLHGRNSHP